MKPRVSLGSVLASCLWRATLLATAWGQSDDSNSLMESALDNERRTYNGTGNNEDHHEWGSVGQPQVRSLTVANYSDGISAPPGDDRPTPREVLSGVFLAAPSSSSSTSALFVGWGLLIGYDLFLNEDNASEPLDIACDDAPLVDVWCPLGSSSEPISFNRSQSETDAEDNGTRSPINYATAYLDLDWLYGRDNESARAIRTLELGYLNVTTAKLPHLLPDGTWLVADQRPTKMPVTFALMTLLIREHNRCCDVLAPEWDADTDEDAYHVCRQWTITVFQHITENDFIVRIVGGNAKTLGGDFYDDLSIDDDTATVGRRLTGLDNDGHSLNHSMHNATYDPEMNAGADVVFSTVAIPAFYSAIPPTVGLMNDSYDVISEHGIELATASADMPAFIERIGEIEHIIRGAAHSRTQAVDVSFMAEVSSSSPLFNLPVVAIQRGRDHGIPSYNDVREAYGLPRASTFDSITSDDTVQGLLEGAYDKVEMLDAYTGALAESQDGSGLFVGPLLRAVILDQVYRAIVGDRHHHSHTTENENAELSTLSGLILDNSMVSSISLDAFTAPETVSASSCSSTEVTEVYLADGFKLAWNDTTETDSNEMHITISAQGIEEQGMIAIGFGGGGMTDTGDFVICEVFPGDAANCTDRSATTTRDEPPIDAEGEAFLEVLDVSSTGEWTSVKFARQGAGNDDSDYPLADDIASGHDTPIIYAWRSGAGIGKHPSTQRGDTLVNFADGSVSSTCDDSNDYYALHGALLLFVWMIIAPYGIYQARYRKGQATVIGNLWWEMHQDCMVVCAEALLPLAITAIFTTGGPHTSEHARWGLYMIAAIVLQIATGWARSRALLGKGNNFSLFHRANKYFHIYSGWFAYVAGLVQCYRGLELVSGAERLVFSAVDIDFTLGNFKVVRSVLFPIWLAIVPVFFIVLETRKQFRRFFTKGTASLCGIVDIINDGFSDEDLNKDRLMPRTEELPLYTMEDFNKKILNGRRWVILDAAVLDVSSFARRHPGGARMIMNAMGTDVTSEIIGEDASIGNCGMAFAPHPHTDTALEIARSLVVGYIEEDDDMGTCRSDEDEDGDGTDIESSGRQYRIRARRLYSMSSSDGEGSERRSSTRASRKSPHVAGVPREGGRAVRSGSHASSSGDEGEVTKNLSIGRGSSVNSRGSGENGNESSSDSINELKSYSTDSSDGQDTTRSGAPGGTKRKKIKKKAPGGVLPVGAAVTLSAEAAAIVNPTSPRSRTSTPPPPPPPARNRQSVAAAADVAVGPPVDDFMLPFASPFSGPGSFGSGRREGRSSRGRSMSFKKPLELEHPVERSTTVLSGTKAAATETVPNTNPIRRILKRIGSRIDSISGASGDESDSRQDDRSAEAARRLRARKNPLDFFHVCPLLLHKKMREGDGRSVYKFVFACPGRAADLVNAMAGVCHFDMRLAQEAGMTVVQRSYNAFAVRVQGLGGPKLQVLPAGETSEGELCIEMRIRLYPDGLMSSLLLQLVKNFDNPAVQLRGPFLHDDLIPPPAHRNVVMIAAGTGVNPMVQMIRGYLDYVNPDNENHGLLPGVYSRLVLIWQNCAEADFYCADELAKLKLQNESAIDVAVGYLSAENHQNPSGASCNMCNFIRSSCRSETLPPSYEVKAMGLLEITPLVTGDRTRRNVPRDSFGRARARLISKGRKAGLINKSADDTLDIDGDRGRARNHTPQKGTPAGPRVSAEFKHEEESKLDGEGTKDVPLRVPDFGRALSRVTEEDYLSRDSSVVSGSVGFGDRDVESGGGGDDLFRSPMAILEGVEEREIAADVGGSVRSNTRPWEPTPQGGTNGSAGGSGHDQELSISEREESGHSCRGQEILQTTGRVANVRAPSGRTLVSNRSAGVVGNGANGNQEGSHHLELSIGGGEESGRSRHSEDAVQLTSRVENKRAPSGRTLMSNRSTGMVGNGGGCRDGGDSDGGELVRGDSSSVRNTNRSFRRLFRQEGSRNLSGSIVDRGTRSRVGTVVAGDEASFGRVSSPKIIHIKNNGSQANEGGGGSGAAEKQQVAQSLHWSSRYRSRTSKNEAAVTSGDGERPSSWQGQPPSPFYSGYPISAFVSSARRRRGAWNTRSPLSGEKTNSHASERQKTPGSSTIMPSGFDKASEALKRSPLDDLGGGLYHSKLSRAILQKIIGPAVMKDVASVTANSVANARQRGSPEKADGSRLNEGDLVGTENKADTLQVVVSGPAGFVLRVGRLLRELGIPSEAVVRLD